MPSWRIWVFRLKLLAEWPAKWINKLILKHIIITLMEAIRRSYGEMEGVKKRKDQYKKQYLQRYIIRNKNSFDRFNSNKGNKVIANAFQSLMEKELWPDVLCLAKLSYKYCSGNFTEVSFLTVLLKNVFHNMREQTKKEKDRIQEKNENRRKLKSIPGMILGKIQEMPQGTILRTLFCQQVFKVKFSIFFFNLKYNFHIKHCTHL